MYEIMHNKIKIVTSFKSERGQQCNTLSTWHARQHVVTRIQTTPSLGGGTALWVPLPTTLSLYFFWGFFEVKNVKNAEVKEKLKCHEKKLKVQKNRIIQKLIFLKQKIIILL